MKKFIKNIALFSLPLLILFTAELSLIKTTTYRPWEALSFYDRTEFLGHYYPNSTMSMQSQGDLCHHTDKAVYKNEKWITDAYGFRNDSFLRQADIILIGDSFTVGSSLNQDEIISKTIQKIAKDSILVYNMAPAKLATFDFYLRNNIIEKPKLLIFSGVERKDIEAYQFNDKLNNQNEILKKIQQSTDNNLKIIFDKVRRMYLLRYLKARTLNARGKGLSGKNNMFFLHGETAPFIKDSTDLFNDVEVLESYKKYCDFMGINFLFLPMPNKESVYFDLVPLQNQPDYLFKLNSQMENFKIPTINVLEIYNSYREKNENLLYHLDDTHWNSNAVKLVSKEVLRHYFMLPIDDKKNLLAKPIFSNQ